MTVSEILSIEPGATERTSEFLQVSPRKTAVLRIEGDVADIDSIEPLVSFTNEEAIGPIETDEIGIPDPSAGSTYARLDVSGLSLLGFDVTASADASEAISVSLLCQAR
ncbi:hypothetical protein [Halalkalicoccus subterraneus]|uniref:hypothetical protein n=1 Tax=Halalkalicoccus subterraneus TaxID=2675002 RepID=UPI000EFA6178|nr:hypothetical protein [Halalkalicoccus subterraneus]